jgi:hypothetical protein
LYTRIESEPVSRCDNEVARRPGSPADQASVEIGGEEDRVRKRSRGVEHQDLS